MKIVLSVLICLLLSTMAYSQNIDYEAVIAEFTADTARINQEIKTRIDTDWSTSGLVESSIFYEQEYDKLLNKYYKILYSALNDDGKKALKQTQLNWIKLRDSDKEFVSAMRNQIFADGGGGTMWSVISAGTRSDITFRRVIELYHFLLFSDTGAR